MTTRKLNKKQWRTFFDHVSTMLEGKQAEIEVASLRLGDQIEAEWLPLLGITYDPEDDLVEVALEEWIISSPSRETFMSRMGPADWWRSKSSMRTTPSKSSSCAIH
jgi:hypothetical protein